MDGCNDEKIDADHISGGITRMRIWVYDGTHDGGTADEVYR